MLSQHRCHLKFKAERNETWREESKEKVLAAKGTICGGGEQRPTGCGKMVWEILHG